MVIAALAGNSGRLAAECRARGGCDIKVGCMLVGRMFAIANMPEGQGAKEGDGQ